MIDQQLNSTNDEKVDGKKPLGATGKMFSIIIILANLGLILRVAYLMDKKPEIFGEFGGIRFSIIFILLIAVGLILSISLLVKRKKHIITFLLLIISIPGVSSILIKPASLLWTTKYQDQLVSAENQKSKYQNLFNQLSGPQKVLYVDLDPINKTNVIILENGDMIRFGSAISSNTQRFSIKSEEVFVNWARANLVGKNVVIKLPVEDSGFRIQLCSELESVPTYITDPVFQLRSKYNISKDKGGYCNILFIYKGQSDEEYGSGDILFEGKSLDESYPK